MTKKKEIVFLLIIIAIASFFRLYKLNSIPPGLYPDVGINGNEAFGGLKTGNFKLFYPENNGREGLMMWLIALSFSIFGVSIWSIKIVAAIIGILTVLGLYLLTNELFSFNSPTFQHSNTPTIISLLSSFFLAISFWHVNFSRIGFRGILLPFILVFSFYFLFKGFRTKKIGELILAGLIFGLGFYTYISFRMAVILLLITLSLWWLIYKKQNLRRQFFQFAICNLTFAILTALPIGFYLLQNPQDFVGRVASISVFATESPVKEFFKSLILHFGMFNFYGDPNWRHNFAGSPMLFWPIGILFLIGLFYSISQIEKTPFGFLISWWLIMLLPGILTYEGIPHALRTIGVIPVVYIFAALGGNYLYNWLNNKIENKKFLLVAGCLLLIFFGFAEFQKYFLCWAENPEVKNAFSLDYVKMGNYLNSLPKEIKKYVIVNMPGVPVPYPNGIPMPAQTIMFVENTKYGKIQSTYLLPEDLDKIKIDGEKTVILLMRYDEQLFDTLKYRFPQGEIEERNGILMYKINFYGCMQLI